MREILFRAKSNDSSEWEYKWLCISSKIQPTEKEIKQIKWRKNINEKTIGMYSEYEDRNYGKIFDGDILRFQEYFMLVNIAENNHIGFVYCKNGLVCIDCTDTEGENGIYELYKYAKNSVIVGNIYDNPELLKEE